MIEGEELVLHPALKTGDDVKAGPRPASLSVKTLNVTFLLRACPEHLLNTYQVTELEHQEVGNRFYTLSDTLKNIRMLKNTGKNKSRRIIHQGAC